MRRLMTVLLALGLSGGALPAGSGAAATVSDVPCKGGKASQYTCDNLDLLSHMAPGDLGGGTIVALWGWKDPETGDEYAAIGKSSGLAFVRLTDAKDPVYLGSIPKSDPVLPWVDVEIFKDHAFYTSESVGGLGIFDMTRLRDVEAPQTWAPDLIYPGMPNAHTMRIDQDSGFLYMNGTLTVPGLVHIVDINEPMAPLPAGYIADDGYVHDSHCVTYRGPDKDYKKTEICLTQNEDSLNIYDVTSKITPERIAKVTYESAAYTHSGWLTSDHKYFLMSDEGDEQDRGLPTTTYIWDVRDLEDPKLIGTYYAKTKAIDHNIYIKGRYAYQASYTAGLRVLDTKKAGAGKLKEVAFFDVMPESDEPVFEGSWGAYPFLPSGNILVTGMGQGLFVLKPTF